MFFVISGYIMMYILDKKERSVKEFVLARFFRIAPLYYLFTFIIIVIGHANELTIMHILQSLVFLKTPTYTSPVLSVGWTLEYEFIFYMMIAFSLLFTKNIYKIFLITSILIFLAFIAIDLVLFPQKMYGHFLEFWFGMLIFFLLRIEFNFLTNFRLALLFLIGFSWYSLANDFLLDENGKAFLRFITFGIPSTIIFFCFVLYEKRYGMKKNDFMLLIGNASFSIYISHVIFLHLYYDFTGYLRGYSLLSDLLSAVFALISGILVYIFIEKRIINFTHKNILKKTS